jgi:hypothetical protein
MYGLSEESATERIGRKINMASLTKHFWDGKERHELTFNGVKFDYTMLPFNRGSKSDKPGFANQVGERYPELADDDDVMNLLNNLCGSDDDETLDIIDTLTEDGY